ncbi:MAG TPA: DedA family protein [Dehalococcoidia bacterium]|nr:DedA family protein [Dehalococcoidia bacterium]
MSSTILALGPLSQLAEWVTRIVESLGYLGVGILTILEHLFPPIPSELILPLAGFLSGQGRFQLPIVIAVAATGSLIGSLILYSLGRFIGQDRVKSFVRDHGKWLLMDEEDFDKARDWFDKHGNKAVFLGRFVPGIRSIISVPAGIDKMSVPAFIVFTALGSALWDGGLVLLGWWLGSNWQAVEKYGQYLEYGGLVLIAGALAWWVKGRWGKKGPRAHQGEAGQAR